jgi:beta-glucanase (GH16 family)
MKSTKHDYWIWPFAIVLLCVLPGAGCSLIGIEPKPEWELEGWTLVWHDEFDSAAGTLPDAAIWTPEIGDGSAQGIPGWGNREREYYTDSADNVATDGDGNLVITVREVDENSTKLTCYYGPCKYTSARLTTWDKAEVAYGRVEARIKTPIGQGIWPAFWMLGTNLDEVGWPQCGEIDILENIGSEPAAMHGTVHGPGYSGAHGIGGDFKLPAGKRFADDFYVFAIEWEPEEIRWYVDGDNYLTLAPNDIPSQSEWVFDHPFFVVLNVAVGGYWPGDPDETTTFPQAMYVDYVRVYQPVDEANAPAD